MNEGIEFDHDHNMRMAMVKTIYDKVGATLRALVNLGVINEIQENTFTEALRAQVTATISENYEIDKGQGFLTTLLLNLNPEFHSTYTEVANADDHDTLLGPEEVADDDDE